MKFLIGVLTELCLCIGFYNLIRLIISKCVISEFRWFFRWHLISMSFLFVKNAISVRISASSQSLTSPFYTYFLFWVALFFCGTKVGSFRNLVPESATSQKGLQTCFPFEYLLPNHPINNCLCHLLFSYISHLIICIIDRVPYFHQ